MKCHYTPIRMVKIKQPKNYLNDTQQLELSHTAGRHVKWHTLL